MKSLHLLLTILLVVANHCQTAMSFPVVWNSPYPDNCPSQYKKNFPSDIVSKFNIDINNNTAFNGDKVTTMYNNPNHMTLGRWPCIDNNGTAINGGVPQLGNLSLHLHQVRLDIAKQLPVGFDGWAVIDWEVWVPSFDILKMYSGYEIYYNRSMALAHGNETEAKAAWNKASLEFMVATLNAAQQIRPRAKLGYYGMVQCTFNHTTKECSQKFLKINDQWKSLWEASSALYPELYATCKFSGGNAAPPPHCDKNASLKLKLTARLREAKRVQALYTDGGKTPYVGFTWYALDDGVCTRNVGHCPLMKSRDDLSAEFQSGKEFGAAAIVVWGSSGDVRNVDDCKELESYLETTLGPMLRGVV